MGDNENNREGLEGENQETISKNSYWGKMIDARLVGLFVLGLLIGVTVKTQALKTVTMGFEDYKLKNAKQEFMLSEEAFRQVEQQEAESGENELLNDEVEIEEGQEEEGQESEDPAEDFFTEQE